MNSSGILMITVVGMAVLFAGEDVSVFLSISFGVVVAGVAVLRFSARKERRELR